MLIRVTLALVAAIFAVNVWLDRPATESFLFALALAVGLTPELLPAIVSITLARGAHRMAREQDKRGTWSGHTGDGAAALRFAALAAMAEINLA